MHWFLHKNSFWWAEVDSNHRSRRRQIYSLIHLAALESAHMKLSLVWSRWLDSNPQPADYKSAALPIELHQHKKCGASGWNRTADIRIFSPPLYQLSYRGICSVFQQSIKKKWRPKTGSNRRPPAWQAGALTNWATGPSILLFCLVGLHGFEPRTNRLWADSSDHWAKGPRV